MQTAPSRHDAARGWRPPESAGSRVASRPLHGCLFARGTVSAFTGCGRAARRPHVLSQCRLPCGVVAVRAAIGEPGAGSWQVEDERGGRRDSPDEAMDSMQREPGVGQPCRYPPLSPEIPASQASSAPGKPWLSRGRVEEGIPYSVFRHLFLIFLFPFPSFASFLEGGIYNGLVRHRYGLACNYRYCIPEHRDWVVCFLHPPGCH